jgi:hypothetical protein
MVLSACGKPPSCKRGKLGPVGGRIVTEVFLNRLLRSHPSIIRSGFIPGPPIAPSKGEFSFADFLVFAGVGDG